MEKKFGKWLILAFLNALQCLFSAPAVARDVCQLTIQPLSIQTNRNYESFIHYLYFWDEFSRMENPKFDHMGREVFAGKKFGRGENCSKNIKTDDHTKMSDENGQARWDRGGQDFSHI